MIITNNDFNTLPEQVQENKNNIEELAKHLKEIYNAKITIDKEATTIYISQVEDWKEGTTTGFILDKTGDLFNIIAVDETTIYIKYWATLTSGPEGPRGPQGLRGPEGPTGPQGPKGEDGKGFENLTDVNLVVGEPSVTYDTEDGITIVSQGNFKTEGAEFTPTVEQNIPLLAGNGLTMDATEDGQHVDIHFSAETRAILERALKTPVGIPSEIKIVAVDTTNSQELLSLNADQFKVENGSIAEKNTFVDLFAGGINTGTTVNINGNFADYRFIIFTVIIDNAYRVQFTFPNYDRYGQFKINDSTTNIKFTWQTDSSISIDEVSNGYTQWLVIRGIK